jgi:hypothetical protein
MDLEATLGGLTEGVRQARREHREVPQAETLPIAGSAQAQPPLTSRS